MARKRVIGSQKTLCRGKALMLRVLPLRFAVCRLLSGEMVPGWLYGLSFWAATRTDDELSVVLPEENVPADWLAERGWRCLKVQGPLDFGLTGVLASLTVPLAGAGIPIFAISTYDTDYFLVHDADLSRAIEALSLHGHLVEE